jgi:hypothetical protein
MAKYRYSLDSMKVMIILTIVEADRTDPLENMLYWSFRQVLNKYYETFPEGDL